MNKERMIWSIKQLLPFKYESTYRVHDDDGEWVSMYSTWRMWLGKPFNIHHEQV